MARRVRELSGHSAGAADHAARS